MATMTRVHVEVPDDLHRRAKATAALRGQSLKDFLIQAMHAAVGDPEPEPDAGPKD